MKDTGRGVNRDYGMDYLCLTEKRAASCKRVLGREPLFGWCSRTTAKAVRAGLVASKGKHACAAQHASVQFDGLDQRRIVVRTGQANSIECLRCEVTKGAASVLAPKASPAPQSSGMTERAVRDVARQSRSTSSQLEHILGLR